MSTDLEAWHVMARDVSINRKQFRQSLKTQNKKVAIQRALELDRKLAVGESPIKVTAATISEAIAAYKEYLTAENRAAKTKNKYWRAFASVEGLAQKLGRNRVPQIDLAFMRQVQSPACERLCSEDRLHRTGHHPAAREIRVHTGNG